MPIVRNLQPKACPPQTFSMALVNWNKKQINVPLSGHDHAIVLGHRHWGAVSNIANWRPNRSLAFEQTKTANAVRLQLHQQWSPSTITQLTKKDAVDMYLEGAQTISNAYQAAMLAELPKRMLQYEIDRIFLLQRYIAYLGKWN